MSADLILTLNAGSSSIKFGAFEAADEPTELLGGQVERLGGEARLVVGEETRTVGTADHAGAVDAILDLIGERFAGRRVSGVGHRVVHGGMNHDRPVVLDNAGVATLTELVPLAPLHQPHNLAGIAAARGAFPGVPQVACFDTAFHRTQPFVEDAYALPVRYYDEGVRAYGFHGLSYDYIAGWLAANAPDLHAGRTIVAHLGNGASMCALHGGRSVGSTMGFSVLDGLVMGTRPGRLDPGIVLYLMERGMGADEIGTLLYRGSGLKGLSADTDGEGGTNDMRALLAREAEGDQAATHALAMFVHRLRREIGSLAAVLGGLDAIVFTGGIGENAPAIRARAAESMDWLGLSIDPVRNEAGETEIGAGTVRALVVPTNEELVIARAVAALS